jgi:type II secretory ATPase GspE/PulE/Tfp pilus assembly ATPase PilB-like protein
VVAQDNIKIRLQRDIKVTICSQQEIAKAIDSIYYQPEWHRESEDSSIKYEPVERSEHTFQRQEDILEIVNNETEAAKAPVVRFVDLLLKQAVENRASDIHIEPQAKAMIIRIRIDGMLKKVAPPPGEFQKAVITRIKILTEMDIAEKRLPQDGRFKAKILDREIDFRVSTIPSKYGENIVMRILDPQAVNHNIEQLGFEANDLEQFKSILSQPNGIIIVTGPTGSGKKYYDNRRPYRIHPG